MVGWQGEMPPQTCYSGINLVDEDGKAGGVLRACSLLGESPGATFHVCASPSDGNAMGFGWDVLLLRHEDDQAGSRVRT